MSEPRVKLNDQWCEFHWAPYRDESPRPNGILAAMALMREVIKLQSFTESVDRKKKLYGISRSEAANMTMEDMVRSEKKSLCCILGDAVMDRILEKARAASADGAGHG